MANVRKVLLAEDSQELREMYATFLQLTNFTVALAADGDDCLRVAKEFRPDLIFLDIMMPKKDGFEVLKILRHDPTYNCTTCKIVMLTNLGDRARVSPEARKDMDGYLVKAEVELKDLLKLIESFNAAK